MHFKIHMFKIFHSFHANLSYVMSLKILFSAAILLVFACIFICLFLVYRFRNDEIFKRMKISTFVHLVIQVESTNQSSNVTLRQPLDEYDDIDRESRADTDIADEEVGKLFPGRQLESSRSTARSEAESVISHRSTLQRLVLIIFHLPLV